MDWYFKFLAIAFGSCMLALGVQEYAEKQESVTAMQNGYEQCVQTVDGRETLVWKKDCGEKK